MQYYARIIQLDQHIVIDILPQTTQHDGRYSEITSQPETLSPSRRPMNSRASTPAAHLRMRITKLELAARALTHRPNVRAVRGKLEAALSAPQIIYIFSYNYTVPNSALTQ